MLTLKLDPREASVEKVRRKLHLKKEEIDSDYGVVPINPKENLFVVLVEPETAARVSNEEWVQGPFANPKIEAFGPPKRDSTRGDREGG